MVTGFFLLQRRDSNPTGCGAEETRKRFPAQHARSGATQRKRAAPAARGHPAGGTTESEKPVALAAAGFLLPMRRDSNPEGIKSHCHPRARGQKIANMSTVTNLVTAISCHQKAIWTQGVLRRRNCRRLSAKYLDICCVTLHILQKDNATGLVTVLIFDVFCPRPLIAWANQLQSGIQSVLRKQKAGATRCGPRLNTVTICQLRSTRRTGCRRRSGPASSRLPRSPPWHPRRRAAYP